MKSLHTWFIAAAIIYCVIAWLCATAKEYDRERNLLLWAVVMLLIVIATK